jgi:DNA-binding FadR family transcriptional regulator
MSIELSVIGTDPDLNLSAEVTPSNRNQSNESEGPGGEVHRLPSELVFRPIRSRNLFEETVARLGQAIKLGVVPRGERFPAERELADQLKVSRVTVREALRALEQAGLVEIRRGRNGGAYVLGPDVKQSEQRMRKLLREMGADLDDAIDFRLAIEPAIVALAAERRTEEQLTEAFALLEESQQMPIAGFPGADSRFHLSLGPMAHSPSLSAALTEVHVRFGEILGAMPIIEESVRHSIAQHRKILEEIEAGNADGARAEMTDHVEATAVLLRSLS